MDHGIELSCRCGEIHGTLNGVTPANCNRVICYCEDCRAFLHHLERAELLDAQGGTEVVQVAPAAVTFERGTERIACVRLTSKGLYRWYASCCKTPLGNTLTPSVPFIGIPWELLRGTPDVRARDEAFGRVRAASFAKSAMGGPPQNLPSAHLGHLLKAVWLVLSWRFRGSVWPHPFFDRTTKAPRYPVAVLSPNEREALRARNDSVGTRTP